MLQRKAFCRYRCILKRNAPASGNRHPWAVLLVTLVVLWTAGCGRSLIEAPVAVHRNTPDEISEPQTETAGAPAVPPSGAAPETRPSPQAQAALELQQQAIAALNAKRPETAIRIQEQALALSPQNGANYYYLADAWILNGDARKAGEFNRLAVIYLKDQPSWARRLDRQRHRIQKAQP